MKEKDYNSIYERYFNEYIDEYINEMEGIYKSSLEEGDAEDIAHECCVTILKEKVIGLKINNQPHRKLYLIFKSRTKLVQDTNPNRLYTKYIIPACEELRNELNEDIIEDYIKEFAILEVHYLLLERYVQWSVLYKMMFDRKDFTEFRIIKKPNFPEGSKIFNLYHEKRDTECQVEGEKILFDFKVLENYKDKFKNIYKDLTIDFINDKRTSQEDFENVFLLKNKEHTSKIYFFCDSGAAAYLLLELKFVFSKLNYTNIEKSCLFYSAGDRPLRQKNLSNSKKAFINKIGNADVDDLMKIIDSILNKLK